jgi:hypothetical protein
MTTQIKLYDTYICYHGFSYTAYIPYIYTGKESENFPNTYLQCEHLEIPTTRTDGWPSYSYCYSSKHNVYELGIDHTSIDIIYDRLKFIMNQMDKKGCIYSKNPPRYDDIYNRTIRNFENDYEFSLQYKKDDTVYYGKIIKNSNIHFLCDEVEKELEILQANGNNIIKININAIIEFIANDTDVENDICINDVDNIEVIV